MVSYNLLLPRSFINDPVYQTVKIKLSGIRVTYSGLISLGGGLVSLIMGIIFIIIVTRNLVPLEYGTWGLIGGLIIYATVLEPMISYWAVRESARGIESGKTAFLFNGIFSIGGIFLYVIVAYLIGNQIDADQNALFFAAILIPVIILNRTLTAINLGWKPQSASYGQIFFGITEILGALIFVYFLDMGIYGVILAVTIAYVVSIIVLFIYAQDKVKNKIQKRFVKKWTRFSWIALTPTIPAIVLYLDVSIFSIITGSVKGLAFWSAAFVISHTITNAALITKGAYSKLLQESNAVYLKENLTQFFYFAIPITSLIVAFAKPALFVLNPIYEIAVPVVIILSIYMFLNTLSGVFYHYLIGIEKVDVDEKSSFKDYIKSKLFVLPALVIIQTSVYIGLLTVGLLLLITSVDSQLDLLVYWAIIALLMQIPFTIYFYVLVRRDFTLTLSLNRIFKYLVVSIGSFGLMYLLMEQFLEYKISIFDFLPNLLLFLILGLGSYFVITYAVDSGTRNLFQAIIKEIKGKNR